ncbi:H-NS histone family protein [Vannielia litorea]|uniref:H-NS histone family protein n=1 Tax=Vannielia litorea TaxID=1217970 RepID=UPI001BCC5FD7|nr:H-NS histone family protein [Vannielia litorea]MBS8225931.1 H-NS histone family protein [Vannielia litorea]
MRRKQLDALRLKIEAKLNDMDNRDKQAAIASAEAAAKGYGFTLNELVGQPKKKRKDAGKPTSPKYKHPDNPAVTWSGRGRKPAWIKEGLESGKSLEEYLIR